MPGRAGPIPTEIGLLAQITQLHLFGNALTGALLCNCDSLLLSEGARRLGTAWRLFISLLCAFELRDLSRVSCAGALCALAGWVPTQIGQLTRLEALNLSHNELGGVL